MFARVEHPVLQDGQLVLRQLRLRDASALEQVLLQNRAWLQPWEATLPGGAGVWDIRASLRSMAREAKRQSMVPWVLEMDSRIVGLLTMANIQWGAVLQGTVGYWVAQEVAGRGVAPTAVALACDYAFGQLGLHRVEVCICPENALSLRVVEKLGFRYEGRRSRYIHIDGQWRDHYCFGLVCDDAPQGVLARWRAGEVDERLAARPGSGVLA